MALELLDFTGMFGKTMGHGYTKGSGKFLLMNLSPIGILVIVLLGALWLWMLVDCLNRNFKKDVDKLIWVGLLLLVPLLGVFLYYFMVKARKK
tara:strand:+ start:342 stop:620 length:279 start_codon:yes stop_codon:yes gene_type:complete